MAEDTEVSVPADATGEAGTARRRPTLRERQKASTRRALLDGAREAFEESGYAATIEEIADRAGTSRGTFYLYFSKGEALAQLVTEAFLADGDGEAADLLHSDISGLEVLTVDRLRKWIGAFVKTWETNRLLGRAWLEGDINDPEVQAISDDQIRRRVDGLANAISSARKQRGLPVSRKEARARAAAMDLQLQYFTYHMVIRGLDLDRRAGIDAIAQSWYAQIFGVTTPDGGVVVDPPS